MPLERVQGYLCDHRLGTNLVLGLLAVMALVAAFQLRRRPEASVLCLVGLSFTFGLALSIDDFLDPWDERLHALVGQNLIQHPWMPTLWDVELRPQGMDWGHAHVWVHKPPLSLWLIASSLRVLGRSELAVRLPSLLLLCAMVWAVYRLGKLLFSVEVGLLAAFLCAVFPQLLVLASGREPTDHPESQFASLVCLATLAALSSVQSRRVVLALLAGGLVGLAVLTKWLPALIVFLLWAAYVPWGDEEARRPWHLVLAAAVCVSVFVPWQLWIHHAFPLEAATEAEHARRHLVEPLDGHTGTVFFHLARIPRFFGELCPAAMLWFLARRAFRSRAGSVVALWFIVPYLFFSAVPTRMQNYVMFAAPAIFLMIALATRTLWAWARTQPPALRRGARLVAAAFLLLSARTMVVERWHPFALHAEERLGARRLRALVGRWGDERVALFNEPRPIEAMFYTGYLAYEGQPTPADLASAQRLGYRVVDEGLLAGSP